MANIAEDYVSPSLRWGIFKEDHPDASVDFTSVKGTELGIPKDFGGDEDYCLATIHRYPNDESPIIGYKPVADAKAVRGDHVSDKWNILCTKALGRAMKRAGYPDTTEDLKLFVLYKQRMAEQEAIREGMAKEDQAPTPAPTPGIVTEQEIEVKQSPLVEEVEPEVVEISEQEAEIVNEADNWSNTWQMEEAHELLKESISGLPESYRQKARDAHSKINGRQWPIESVSQFNALSLAVLSLVEEHDEETATAEA